MKRIIGITFLILVVVFCYTACGESGQEMTLNLSFGDRTGIYNGEVNEEGLPEGQGSFTTSNESGDEWTYTGTFVNGHFEGEGETTWASGGKEIGTYHNDEIQPEPAENIANMYKNPEEYKYHCFTLTGKVFNVVGMSDGQLHFQMNQDTENAENNTYVIYDDDIKLSEDDYVIVTGTVQGTEEYENMLGGTVETVMFHASSVEVVDYKDAVAPTLKEVQVNESKTQYGYKVTVEKVEFAEKETRVYVKVDNGGKSTVSIYAYDAIAVQNGKQYQHEDNWEAEYPELQSDLRSGNSTEGVLVFKGLEQKYFKVIMGGYSDDWEEDIKDFEINVNVY